jgi:glutathione S-transferase
MALQLIIGNKNYSSWSLRPWLAMKVAGIAFEETLISLDASDFKARVAAFGGAGRVPVLIDGDVRVWESLAILEYLAEQFPAAGLWPRQANARARARAIASEMHAGFSALRRHLPMNVARPGKKRALDNGATADAARVDAIWSECRAQFGGEGAFLFGSFSAADAMYVVGGLALPRLCGRGHRRRARLHGRGRGVAGIHRMARSGAARDLGVGARRGRLAGSPA